MQSIKDVYKRQVHDLTAPYDEEHGYVPAGSYENGQVVDSYGGGICQVSTTLYNALLYSEVEITCLLYTSRCV